MPGRPLLILCFSPDRIPGVSMMLMLSRTGFGIWAHINLQERQGKAKRKQKRYVSVGTEVTSTNTNSHCLYFSLA